MKMTSAGIDLAKHVFQVYGVDARGKAVLRKKLGRAKMTEYFINLPPCSIGMGRAAARITGRASCPRWGIP